MVNLSVINLQIAYFFSTFYSEISTQVVDIREIEK